MYSNIKQSRAVHPIVSSLCCDVHVTSLFPRLWFLTCKLYTSSSTVSPFYKASCTFSCILYLSNAKVNQHLISVTCHAVIIRRKLPLLTSPSCHVHTFKRVISSKLNSTRVGFLSVSLLCGAAICGHHLTLLDLQAVIPPSFV